MRRFIKNIFLRNWGLKLFSLILALILWLTLIPEEKIFSEKTLTIPLEPHNIPAEMELVKKPPATIDIVIRAPIRLIDQITPANVVAKLNLEKATVIQEEYPLNTTMISLPQGAEVIRISPNKVNLGLEKTREVMLEVEANIIGELAEGLKIEKIEVIPPAVKVVGAESKIRDKDKVRTSPIDISSLTQSTEFEADFILPNPDLRLASSPLKAKIKITVQEEKTDEEKIKKK
ncbi:MAG: YbbR-like domain-containing protein [Candidatus Aminicenantaceae bacterium]